MAASISCAKKSFGEIVRKAKKIKIKIIIIKIKCQTLGAV